MALCLIGSLLQITAGALLIARHRAAPLLSGAATICFLGFLAKEVITGMQNMDPERGDTLSEALYSWPGLATLIPSLVITGSAVLLFALKAYKPKSSVTMPARPPYPTGYPQR